MIRIVSKLTLSVNPEVAAQAKRFAKQSGVSVSRLVEAYLAEVSRPSRPRVDKRAGEEAAGDDPPVLRMLRGTLKKGNVEDYRRHLAAKYR